MTPGRAESVRARAPHRLAVVHAQLLVGQAVAAALDTSPGLTCREVTNDARRLLLLLPSLAVVVVDQRCLQQVQDLSPASAASPELVVLGDDASVDPGGDCLRALRAGARAWVTAQAAQEDLVRAVAAACAGDLWLPSAIGMDVVGALLEAERHGDRIRALTAKEHEVLRHLMAGHSVARTAELMLVATNTVRSHRTRLFAKLGVHAGHEAAAVARRAGLTT